MKVIKLALLLLAGSYIWSQTVDWNTQVRNKPTIPSTPVSIPNGGTGATTQTGALSNILGSSTVPVANGGTGVTAAQGNGSKVQLSTGATVTNDCVKFDANGNTVDAGAACGTGGGASTGYILSTTYNFTPQTFTGTVTGGGSSTISLAPCPLGLNGSDANHPIFLKSSTAATVTAASYLAPFAITNIANNGLGAIRVTATGVGSSLATNDWVVLWDAPANIGSGYWQVTVIGANDVDLQGSTFSGGAYQPPTSPAMIQQMTKITTSGAHGIPSNGSVLVASVGGNTATNSLWVTRPIDATHLWLYGSRGNANYTSGGTLQLAESTNITGGTCVAGSNGNVTVTSVNSYTNPVISSATAGVQEAIQAATGSTQDVFVPQGTYTWYGPVNLNGASNFALRGVPGGTTINFQGTANSVSVIKNVGSVSGTQTTVASNVNCGGGTALNDPCRAKNSTNSITVASTAGFSVGDYVLLTYQDNYKVSGGTVILNQIAKILSISAPTIQFSDRIVIPLNTNNTNDVQKLNMISGVTISGLTIDGTSASGQNLVAVDLEEYRESLVADLYLRNFLSGPNSGGGLNTNNGYANTHRSLTFEDVDTQGAGASWYPTNETHLTFTDIKQKRGSFGPEAVRCTMCNGTNIISESTTDGRGTKWSGMVASNISNVHVMDAGATGFSIMTGSYNNNFSNIVISGTRGSGTGSPGSGPGINFSSENNIYNNLTNVQAWVNTGASNANNADLVFGCSGNYCDQYNTISNFNGSWVDQGTSQTNQVMASQQIRVRAHNSVNQNIANGGANVALTFDTNDFDSGAANSGTPIHSTSSNTSHFTVPHGGSGWYALQCQVTWGFDASNARGINLQINAGGTLAFNLAQAITTGSAGNTQTVAIPEIFMQDDSATGTADYAECYVQNYSGTGALNAIAGTYNTYMTMYRVH